MLNCKDPTFAHAELFGHSSHFGRVQETIFCGSPGLSIEPLTVDGLLPPFFVAGAAIFRLTPMSKDDARHAVLPRAWRVCAEFQAAPVLPASCRVCGRNEKEHEEERQRKALPPPSIPDADLELEEEEDFPFEGPSLESIEDEGLVDALSRHLAATPRDATQAQRAALQVGFDRIELIRAPLPFVTTEPLGDRIRAAIASRPAVDAAFVAAEVRTSVDLVGAALAQMGWAFDGRLWQNPDDGITSGGADSNAEIVKLVAQPPSEVRT